MKKSHFRALFTLLSEQPVHIRNSFCRFLIAITTIPRGL